MYDPSWQSRHASKVLTPAQAIARIAPGRRILVGSGAAEPVALVEALATHGDHLVDNDIVHLLTLGSAPYVRPELAKRFRHAAFFIGPNVREAVQGLALPNIEAPEDALTPERVVIEDPTRWPMQPLPDGLGWRQRTWYPRCALIGALPAFLEPGTVTTEERLKLLPTNHVALALQRSVRKLERIAPLAFGKPLALAIDPGGSEAWPAADDCFRVLGIRHRAVPEAAVRAWVPQVKLAPGCRAWRVRDGVMDLRILSACLAARVHAAGVEIVRERVTGITVSGDRVTGLQTPRTAFSMTPDDVVVFGDFGGTIHAMDKTSYTEKWKASVENERVRSGPAIVDDVVVIADRKPVVTFINLSDGQVLNRVPITGAGTVRADLTVKDGNVYLATTNGRLFRAEPEARRVVEIQLNGVRK